MSGSYLPGGRSFGARWLALVILCAASLMVILDGTIVTVALPTIQVGLALLTTLAASRTGSGTSAQDLTSGCRLALVAGAVLGGASVVVAAVALRPSATGAMTAQEGTAATLTPPSSPPSSFSGHHS